MNQSQALDPKREAFAQAMEAPVSGVMVRVVAQRGVSVGEWFTWPGEYPQNPERYAGYFGDNAQVADAYEVDEESGWGPIVVYRRVIPGGFADDAEAQAFFAGNRALDQVVMSVNLAHVEPMDAERAWELLADSAQAAGSREQALRRALSELTVSQVEQFCACVERWARELDTDEAAAIAGPTFVRGSDGFRAWRFGVVAQGREVFEAVRAGEPRAVAESDVEFGFALGSLGERVIEDLTGVAPEFVFDPKAPAQGRRKKRLSAAEQLVREQHGDGTADLRPGPRDVRSMWDRGLFGGVVVARCVVRSAAGYEECLIAQHIDVYGEDVARHVRDAVNQICAQLGAAPCTPAEWFDTGTDRIHAGSPCLNSNAPGRAPLRSTWSITDWPKHAAHRGARVR